MNTLRLITLCTLSVICVPSTVSYAAELPHLPYRDWGACPFECCTYKAWETTRAVAVHEKPDSSSKPVFTLGAGRSVQGITGVVITHQAGVTRILKPIEIGYDSKGKGPLLSLKAGERIYTLHYVGAGHDLFWYRGKIYTDQIALSDDAFGNISEAPLTIESRPRTEWWAKIRSDNGHIGWTEVRDNFDHIDACE